MGQCAAQHQAVCEGGDPHLMLTHCPDLPPNTTKSPLSSPHTETHQLDCITLIRLREAILPLKTLQELLQ